MGTIEKTSTRYLSTDMRLNKRREGANIASKAGNITQLTLVDPITII